MLALLFDVDGTLIDADGAGRLAMEAALRELCGDDRSAEQISFAGRTDRSLATELFALHQVDETPVLWETFASSYAGHLPRTLAMRNGRVLPGVNALLEHLVHHCEVQLGLLTGNTRQAAQHKLEHFSLWHHFPCGGFGDLADRCNVAARAVDALSAHYGAPPQPTDLWVIGDTPSDIVAAHAVGARCLAVATGQFSAEQLTSHGADVVMDNLTEWEQLATLWRW